MAKTPDLTHIQVTDSQAKKSMLVPMPSERRLKPVRETVEAAMAESGAMMASSFANIVSPTVFMARVDDSI